MKRGVCAALVAAVAICGAGAPAAASGSDVPRTPAGWRVTPAGHLLTVTQGPGLSGPWGGRALARRPPRAGHVERPGGPGRDARDVRHHEPRADRRARDERPPRPLGLLRRRVLAGRPAGVGLGRRAGCPARLLGDAGRQVRPRRPDPGRPFPGGDRLRADAARRPPVCREQPRCRSVHHGAVRGPARPPGDGHQPEHGPDHGHDRPGDARRPVRRRLQPRRDQGVRHELDGPLGLGHRHERPARAEDDPALAGRRSAPGRPSHGDRRQPAKRRDLHGQRLERHRERPRLAPRSPRRHHRRRPRPGRAEGVDAGGARGQPGRRDALRRRRR